MKVIFLMIYRLINLARSSCIGTNAMRIILILFLVIPALFLMPENVYAVIYNPAILQFSAADLQTAGSLYISIILAVVVIAVCILYLICSFRVRKINRELREKTKQVSDINNELALKNELITKQLNKSDKFYSMILQAADDGISFHSSDGKLIYANNSFYSNLGLEKDSYNSLTLIDLLHPDDADYESNKTDAIKSKGSYECEIRIKNNDGKYVYFSNRSVAVRDENGEILGVLTILRDISKLKKAHEKLKKENVEATASSSLKSSFLANISHEIRTPLNSVVGFANLLLANNLSNEVKEEYIEHINHNSEKLLQIIGDIIDLSRLESSQIEITYEEASLSSIVTEVIEEARQIIRRNEKPIILNVKNQFEDNGDLIFIDKVWLKRVLSHLMDNAIKFTLDGSIEFIYLLEGDNIFFRIKDTGIGINKENLSRIFEQFRQEIDGHHRPFEGLGIGLTLAKEVIERMGGKIYVESEKGIGSEFRFSLPHRPAGSSKIRFAALGDEAMKASINWLSKKCLIVDDNKDVLIYLNRILADTGVTTITARSGYEAIEQIKKIPDIDVVLLDMQMPEMDGIEATREIRKIRRNVPIIAQTAFIFEDDKDIILEAGCDACLIKPIRKDHLLTVMSSFMKSK